jgi:hypothetical protein
MRFSKGGGEMKRWLGYSVGLIAMIGIAEAQEKPAFTPCSHVLDDVQAFAGLVAWRRDLITDHKSHHHESAAEELRGLVELQENLARAYAAYGGAVSLASNLGCGNQPAGKKTIQKATQCGFVKSGVSCD